MTEEIIKYAQVEISELMDIVTERDRLKQENERLQKTINSDKFKILKQKLENLSDTYPECANLVGDIFKEIFNE